MAKTRTARILAALIALLCADASAQRKYTITDLGTITPTGINSPGQISGYHTVAGHQVAVRWQGGVPTNFQSAGANAVATGINDAGLMSGYVYDGRGVAVVFKNDTSITLLPSGVEGVAYAINDNGHIAGQVQFCDTCSSKAALWTTGNPIDLGAFSMYGGSALGLNNADLVVGSSEAPPEFNEHAFRTTGSGLIDLGTLGGTRSEARGVNNFGTIAGMARDALGMDHAVIWNPGILDIGSIPGSTSSARAINDSDVVVGVLSGPGGNHAFVWEDGSMNDLNALADTTGGWILRNAVDINNAGMIVGTGTLKGQQRGFLLTIGLRVTRPIKGQLWIAGEKDSISWLGGRKDQTVQLDYSVDSGKTFNIIDFVFPADAGSYVWDVPRHIISKKCFIRIMDFNDPSVIDTSDLFKIKPYILTRDSGGQYEPYRRGEDQWGFRNRQIDLFPPVWYQQFDYQGIDPFTNSQYSQWQGNFAFASAIPAEFPDWVSWVRAFGTGACYFSTSFLPLYSPSAVLKWSASASTWGGSCFGIAIANALAFGDMAQLQSKYGGFPKAVLPIAVASDSAAKTVVNELYTHQFGIPHATYREIVGLLKTPTETLNDLKEMFREDAAVVRTLSFRNNGPGDGGHAILAYALEKDAVDPTVYHVSVYDNSNPTSLNRVTINTSANGGKGSWTDPDWPGWGGNQWIYLRDPAIAYLSTPVMAKEGQHQSPFILADDELHIFAPHSTSLRILDRSGNTTGFYNQRVQTDIPGSSPLVADNGSTGPPYGYVLPSGAYSIQMDSLPTGMVKTFFFTGNRTYLYSRDSARQQETDRLFFEAGVATANPDPQTKTVSLTTVINETIREKLFALSSLELSQNDSVKIEQPDSNTIRVISWGTAKAYELELNHVAGGGIGRFGTEGIPLSANTTHRITPDWDNVATATLRILVDRGNDGTIDDTLSLQNRLTGTGSREEPVIPQEYRLEQNYPNPFNPTTTIRYALPHDSYVTVKIYNLLGQKVAVLVDGNEQAGYHSVVWNAGAHASGPYFYRLQAGSFVAMRKLAVVR